MTIGSRSLWIKLLLPGIIIIIVVTSLLLVIIGRITTHVQEDLSRFSVMTAGNEASTILSSAVAEITSAQLLDNPVVAAAKQRKVIESLTLLWSRNGQHGFVTEGGTTRVSTLATPEERALLGVDSDGYFSLTVDRTRLFCYRETFPLWNWTIITADREAPSHFSREMALLVPVVAMGCLLMGAALAVLFRRNIHKPVFGMVEAVGKGERVDRTGVTEFDLIGRAVNDAMQTLRERTTALEEELGERKRAEAAVSEKDEYIRRLLVFTAEGIFGLDTQGVCTFCNPSGLKMLGYASDSEIIGKTIHHLIHHSRPDGTPFPVAECKTCRAYLDGEKVHVQNEVFWRSNGTSFPCEYWAHPILDGDNVAGAVVTFLDISERRQLEDQLLHAQKLEAIGLLAGGIAHDFNNILSAMIGYGELLHDGLEGDARLQRFSEQVIALSKRGGELTRALLLFSRKQDMRAEPVDLGKVVSEVENLLRRLVGENIELKTTICDRRLIVVADRSHIDQVLMNLVTNARDAMPNGGLLSIETSLFQIDEAYAQKHPFSVPGTYACLSVSDTGVGIEEETKEKMFEPFFTTKGIGKGTGLGLSIVYGIVKQHGGFIDVYSEPGIGTRFRICFPLTTESEEAPAISIPIRSGTETILVAEDDADVRQVLNAVLSSNGYTVLEAENGDAAVEIFQENREQVELLLLDVMMPGRNGWEAWEAIRTIRPEVKVVFMSGYTDDIIDREGLLASGMELIEKPIPSEQLLRRIRKVLDRDTVTGEGGSPDPEI